MHGDEVPIPKPCAGAAERCPRARVLAAIPTSIDVVQDTPSRKSEVAKRIGVSVGSRATGRGESGRLPRESRHS